MLEAELNTALEIKTELATKGAAFKTELERINGENRDLEKTIAKAKQTIAENNAKIQTLEVDYRNDVKETKRRPEFRPSWKIAELTKKLGYLQLVMDKFRTAVKNVA